MTQVIFTDRKHVNRFRRTIWSDAGFTSADEEPRPETPNLLLVHVNDGACDFNSKDQHLEFINAQMEDHCNSAAILYFSGGGPAKLAFRFSEATAVEDPRIHYYRHGIEHGELPFATRVRAFAMHWTDGATAPNWEHLYGLGLSSAGNAARALLLAADDEVILKHHIDTNLHDGEPFSSIRPFAHLATPYTDLEKAASAVGQALDPARRGTADGLNALKQACRVFLDLLEKSNEPR